MERAAERLLTPEILADAVGRIVAAFQPRAVIVFGSRARVDARPDSDIDLLVVLSAAVPEQVPLQWHSQALLKDLPVAKDILVSQPDHFAFWSRHRNSVYRTAFEYRSVNTLRRPSRNCCKPCSMNVRELSSASTI